ncbi:hypothetical protein GCM10009798_39600 [Nocardioides panacihumi]|uniref:Uncharacterized protein n=1 Tax=Nocardioides panacihumi TaxID=400774 RepID=A0ABP5D5F1_9ACTN
MTAADVVDAGAERAPVAPDLGSALGSLAEAAVGRLSDKVDEWIQGLEEYAASEGATGGAILAGVKAHLQGKNPVWAAMKGAWSGASVQLRVVAVLVLLLVLLLAPVALLVVILGLLIAAIVAGIRGATR